MAVARYLTTTPLVCGHAFRAEVSPRAGERVWCHVCFDYRHVTKRQPTEPAPAEPQAGTCSRGHERTPENSYQRPNDGSLICRMCRSDRNRRRRDRAKS